MQEDLFPGFDRQFVKVNGVRIFVRTGGRGYPLILIHGCPQSHLMWHAVAPKLAERFSVVLVDLRGYGSSDVAEDSVGGSHYSKRQMASDVIGVMDALGYHAFAVVGHDRGARVGYRLALDHSERVEKLALLDIVPTLEMWEGMDARKAMQVYHWLFFAQPAPPSPRDVNLGERRFLHRL